MPPNATAKDCGATIIGLHPNATENCQGDTVFRGDNCMATCNAGYLGGSATFVCDTDGLWQGELDCTPRDCGARLVLFSLFVCHSRVFTLVF